MGLGPIAALDSLLLPTARKVEQAEPRFEIEATERAGDDHSSHSSGRQQASERERKPKQEDTGDLFQATVEDDGAEIEVVSQISEEGHDWFV